MLYSRHEREVKGKMKNIYDNGTVILGEVKKIKEYSKKQLDNKLIDEEEYLDIENELKYFNDNDIVAVNYDCGMGLSIEGWEPKDIINTDK